MHAHRTVILDGHVHLYPDYRLADALDALFANLGRYAPSGDSSVVRIGLLTDTAAARAYRDRIAQHRPKQLDRFILQPTDEPGAMAIREDEHPLGYLIAGRQIVTAENLEVLALTVDLDLADGLPLSDTLSAVRDAGGIAVLSWSPGKWSGRRGRLVRELITSTDSTGLLLGDTSLRPWGASEPPLFREGSARGFRVLQGTDALPFAGEEARLGTYASALRGPWDSARPVTSLRALLAAPAVPLTAVGHRLSLPAFAVRWTRLMLRKHLR